MAELANCTRCDVVFVKHTRDICHDCQKSEEDAYQTVYQFLTIRKNREATIPEIVEATGVEEKLLIKFLKEKRLQPSQFPKLSYPCEKCDTPIVSGKLCYKCTEELREDLERYEVSEKRKKEQEKRRHTYYVMRDQEKS
ncbi:TIGR03826 family flagellar region protein [Lentibacillus sediminis]|uniref:TIGR03826 family flagellar region protein n=1 Tax=Lentibacillus sediminis TaxID=1940529 RepID=UPI000C1C1FCB|nr:TIGR03826 family flagellar region protein [Lentibacillus sediminis]